MFRRARPLGVPTAQRQTVKTNKLVRIWQFLHRRAESSAQPLATKEPYGCGVPLAGARPTARVRSAARRARPLGVPSAKRQTVQTNRFVRIR